MKVGVHSRATEDGVIVTNRLETAGKCQNNDDEKVYLCLLNSTSKFMFMTVCENCVYSLQEGKLENATNFLLLAGCVRVLCGAAKCFCQ